VPFVTGGTLDKNEALDEWLVACAFVMHGETPKQRKCRALHELVLAAAPVKGKNFFDAEHDPLITFHSTQIVQTGPDTLDYVGDFTIRGVTKPEKLTFTLSGKGTGSGEIKGTMAFDRKDYGMNSGIPFIKIADRVEVTVDLKGKRVSGPPLVFKE